MPVSTGLTVQPSRFAAIALDSDSDSEKESAWHQVPRGKDKSGAKGARGGSHGGEKQAALPVGAAGDEGKVLSKSAKKRARKKRNQSSSAEVCSQSYSRPPPVFLPSPWLPFLLNDTPAEVEILKGSCTYLFHQNVMKLGQPPDPM